MALPAITLNKERAKIEKWAISMDFPTNVFVDSMGWGNSRRIKFNLIWHDIYGYRDSRRIEAAVRAGKLALPTSQELADDYMLLTYDEVRVRRGPRDGKIQISECEGYSTGRHFGRRAGNGTARGYGSLPVLREKNLETPLHERRQCTGWRVCKICGDRYGNGKTCTKRSMVLFLRNTETDNGIRSARRIQNNTTIT